MPRPRRDPGGVVGVTLMDERLDTAPCGFLCFTEDGIVSAVNSTLLEILGYEQRELVDHPIGRILTVGSQLFYQTHWFPLLRLHGRVEEIFLMLRGKSGEEVGVLVNAEARERSGGVEYDCMMMRVRERQKYEDELLRARRTAEQARGEAERSRAAADEANEAKSTFLAVMSHELRTPLNAIGAYLHILEMGIHGPVTDEQRETLQRIDGSQRHLLRLINQLLNLARIEAGHVEYAIEDVPIGEIVAAVTPMVEPQLGSKGVGFEVDAMPDLAVQADREKAQQALLNLLGNAVKFTPTGGRVRLDALVSPDNPHRLLLRVADTGIGIPAEKLATVFEPFVQVDVTRTRGQEGTGLGLSISRDLARGMNGDLTAESTPGEGSTFILQLPLVRRPGSGAG